MDVAILELLLQFRQRGLERLGQRAGREHGLDGTQGGQETAVDPVDALHFALGRFDVGQETRTAVVVGNLADIARQQLQIERKGVERIADLVRDTRGELLDGFDAAGFERILLARVRERDIAYQHDRSRTVGHGAQLQDAMLGIGQLDFARGGTRPVRLGRRGQQVGPVPAGQHFRDRLAFGRCEIKVGQLFRRRIGVSQFALFGNHQDAFTHCAQDGLQECEFVREPLVLPANALRIQLVEMLRDLVEESLHCAFLSQWINWTHYTFLRDKIQEYSCAQKSRFSSLTKRRERRYNLNVQKCLAGRSRKETD